MRTKSGWRSLKQKIELVPHAVLTAMLLHPAGKITVMQPLSIEPPLAVGDLHFAPDDVAAVHMTMDKGDFSHKSIRWLMNLLPAEHRSRVSFVDMDTANTGPSMEGGARGVEAGILEGCRLRRSQGPPLFTIHHYLLTDHYTPANLHAAQNWPALAGPEYANTVSLPQILFLGGTPTLCNRRRWL